LPYFTVMKSPRTWLFAAAFVVAPLVGLAVLLFVIARAGVQRASDEPDSYAAWRAQRDALRLRQQSASPAPAAASETNHTARPATPSPR
jgi:hypothetical protein